MKTYMSKEINEMEMAIYVIKRMKEMKVSKETFLESGTTENLKKTYQYLMKHEKVKESQLRKDLNYK